MDWSNNQDSQNHHHPLNNNNNHSSDDVEDEFSHIHPHQYDVDDEDQINLNQLIDSFNNANPTDLNHNTNLYSTNTNSSLNDDSIKDRGLVGGGQSVNMNENNNLGNSDDQNMSDEKLNDNNNDNNNNNNNNSNNSNESLALLNNDKLIEMALGQAQEQVGGGVEENNNSNTQFNVADSLFINELLSNTSSNHNDQTNTNLGSIDENNNNINLLGGDEKSLLFNSDSSNNNIKLNRFNFKCKYCFHLTKYKARIIEHMLNEHKIDLMECPYTACGRKFKDEWKLKRHLSSNKDHAKLSTFQSLQDSIKQHCFVTPQKIGQYPCPMCQIIPGENGQQDILLVSNMDQKTCIDNFINKNTDNCLYFDKYDDLCQHVEKTHGQNVFNMDSYFICKQCGQVFMNRYKLSCHLFNVHSGKRKRKSTIQTSLTLNPKTSNKIKSSALSTSSFINYGNLQPQNQILLLNTENNKKQFSCIVCTRKFRRARDVQSHVQIMHKNLSEEQKEQLKQEIQKTSLLLTKAKSLRKKLLNQSVKMQPAQHPLQQIKLNTAINQPAASLIAIPQGLKPCPICQKTFKSDGTNTSNRTFSRHMQIQHGMNEKCERLIDCPVCEKWFFNRQQMERHMRTHQSWIHDNNISKEMINKVDNAALNEFKDKHSILYCHECMECNKFFKSIKVLIKHKSIEHNLRPIFKCLSTNNCRFETDQIEQYLEHATIHSQKNISCIKCNAKFSNKNALRNHMKNSHYKITIKKRVPRPRPAKKLQATTSTIFLQTQPQQQQNQDGDIFSILNKQDILNQAPTLIAINIDQNNNGLNFLGSLMTLNDKLSTISNSVGSSSTSSNGSSTTNSYSIKTVDNICPTCGKDFPSRNSLHNHLATHNMNELKLFMCQICTLSFKTRADLSKHVAEHASDLTSQNAVASTSRSNAAARQTTSIKQCTECGETFKTSFHLKRHRLTRHSNIRPFKCNHCEMTFARKDKLKQHEAKHVNHPLYTCQECKKGFYRKEHLKDHEISKHSKQYPFSCEFCSKGFVHAKDLHRHIRVRHLGNTSAAPGLSNGNNTIKNSTANKAKTKKEKNAAQNKQILNTGPLITQITPLQNKITPINTTNFTLNTTSTSDFKSKKISSILKSNLYASPSNSKAMSISSNELLIQLPASSAQQQTFNINNNSNHFQGSSINATLATETLLYNNNNNNNGNQMITIPLNDLNLALTANQTLSNNNNLNSQQVSPLNNQVRLNTLKIRDQLKYNESSAIASSSSATLNSNFINSIVPNNKINNIFDQQMNTLNPINQTQPNQPSVSNSPKKSQTASSKSQLKSFKCNYCSKSFFYENYLKKHIETKHSNNTMNTSVLINNNSNNSALSFNDTQPVYNCSLCSKSFSTLNQAQQHLNKSHINFLCQLCLRPFKSKAIAQRHMNSTHSNISDSKLLEPIKQTKSDAKIIELEPQPPQQQLQQQPILSNQNISIINSNSNLGNNASLAAPGGGNIILSATLDSNSNIFNLIPINTAHGTTFEIANSQDLDFSNLTYTFDANSNLSINTGMRNQQQNVNFPSISLTDLGILTNAQNGGVLTSNPNLNLNQQNIQNSNMPFLPANLNLVNNGQIIQQQQQHFNQSSQNPQQQQNQQIFLLNQSNFSNNHYFME
jgi:hypothetical protein